jgi:hypothetical protein
VTAHTPTHTAHTAHTARMPCRFINAKPTLEASQEQARRTHKWRQQMDVDTVLMVGGACRGCVGQQHAWPMDCHWHHRSERTPAT